MKENLQKRLTKKPFLLAVILAFAGISVGFINGFLGTGGGILLVFVLTFFSPANESPENVRNRFATVIAIILPLSLISALIYGNGKLSFEAASPYLLPGMLGGVLGALLLDKIKIGILAKLFAVMVLWAGFCFFR